MTILIDKDIRANFGPARDQDPRPTCMAFAASDAHAGARTGWQPLSAEWAYYHALKRDGGSPHDGVTMDSMLEALRCDGQPCEEVWPYIARLFTDVAAWAPPAAKQVFRRESNRQSATVEAVIERLDAGDPVLFTMSVSSSFFTPGSDGVIAAVEAIEPARIHALVAVGHGHRQKEVFILVRNSWGEAWELQGYG